MENPAPNNIVASANEKVEAGIQNIGNSIKNAKDYVSESLNEFSSTEQVETSETGFLSSNGYVARFAFLVLVLIVFMFLLNLGVMIIQYFMSPSNTPYVVKGLMPGSSAQTVSQDPNNPDSVITYRSNNRKNGIEYTWSIWLSVDKVGNEPNKVKHIFHKGMNTGYTTRNTLIPDVGNYLGFAGPNNGPGLYLDGSTNKLFFVMDVISPTGELNQVQSSVKIEITDIPMKKWFHLAFRLQNKVLDVYVNGTIVTRATFDYVPKQNYDDIHLCQNGGFLGNISNLRYYDYALSIFELNNIVYWGPNTTASELTKTTNGSNYDFLGSLWYQAKWF